MALATPLAILAQPDKKMASKTNKNRQLVLVVKNLEKIFMALLSQVIYKTNTTDQFSAGS
jgi:hypothetical protein